MIGQGFSRHVGFVLHRTTRASEKKCKQGVHQTAIAGYLIYKRVDGVHFLDNQARPWYYHLYTYNVRNKCFVLQ